jgi:hypothetical protein
VGQQDAQPGQVIGVAFLSVGMLVVVMVMMMLLLVLHQVRICRRGSATFQASCLIVDEHHPAAALGAGETCIETATTFDTHT